MPKAEDLILAVTRAAEDVLTFMKGLEGTTPTDAQLVELNEKLMAIKSVNDKTLLRPLHLFIRRKKDNPSVLELGAGDEASVFFLKVFNGKAERRNKEEQ